jgi:GNAT superfamily N-acetyltransferase
MIIRVAEPQDAERAAALHLACWQEAYAGIIEPRRLAAVTADLDGMVRFWRTMIELGLRWLAEQDGQLIGFAGAGPNDETDLDVPWKLYAIYVRTAYWGTGVGHRLITQVIGEDDAVLWVFRDNVRARDFYTRHGFVADGTEQVEQEFGAVEVRMVRRRGQASNRSS